MCKYDWSTVESDIRYVYTRLNVTRNFFTGHERRMFVVWGSPMPLPPPFYVDAEPPNYCGAQARVLRNQVPFEDWVNSLEARPGYV